MNSLWVWRSMSDTKLCKILRRKLIWELCLCLAIWYHKMHNYVWMHILHTSIQRRLSTTRCLMIIWKKSVVFRNQDIKIVLWVTEQPRHPPEDLNNYVDVIQMFVVVRLLLIYISDLVLHILHVLIKWPFKFLSQ